MSNGQVNVKLGSGLMSMFLIGLLSYLKVNNHIDVSWWVVFLPVLAPLTLLVIMFGFGLFLAVLGAVIKNRY